MMDTLEHCVVSYSIVNILSEIIVDDEEDFSQHCRILPTTFEALLLQIHTANEDLHIIQRGKSEISIEKEMLVTLWCLSNVECFRSVGDRFGVGKSTCWRILYRLCHRLLTVNKLYKIISFPMGDRAMEIINYFENINGFPGTLGVIDGCHIRIDKPHDHPNSYINRKRYPSVILKGGCYFTSTYGCKSVIKYSKSSLL